MFGLHHFVISHTNGWRFSIALHKDRNITSLQWPPFYCWSPTENTELSLSPESLALGKLAAAHESEPLPLVSCVRWKSHFGDGFFRTLLDEHMSTKISRTQRSWRISPQTVRALPSLLVWTSVRFTIPALFGFTIPNQGTWLSNVRTTKIHT